MSRTSIAIWLAACAPWAFMGFAGGRLYETTRSPCEEDQAYVVQEDRNPNHGLTWVCVSLDSLNEG